MIRVPITEVSQVADVRRQAVAIAGTLGFGETDAGRVAIVATELASNLVKFATGGEILLGTFGEEDLVGVELIALDKGPGVGNVAAILSDGFSTAGTTGTGLGAVRRLCNAFDIASWLALGTAVLARIGGSPPAAGRGAEGPSWGAVVVPIKGEIVSGDAISVLPHAEGWTILVADGLGHGTQAAAASNEAVRLFRALDGKPLVDILAAIHAGIRHTRGAAVAVCRFSAKEALVRYAGIGNIEGRIITGGNTKRLVSHAGTAGLAARRLQEFEHPFPPTSVLVMHSDGLSTSWSSSTFPGLLAAHPSLAAAVLYHQCQRGRDDASVVVASAPLARSAVTR